LQNQLQAELFEFQTKFSVYHQKQADVIGTFYEMLSETQIVVAQLVHPLQFEAESTDEDRFRQAFNKKVDLARFFERSRIYFDEEICEQISTVNKTMHKVLILFQSSERRGARNQDTADLQKWNDAFSIMEKEVPVLKSGLESRFRQLLSGTLPSRPQISHSDSAT
jgi:hypothetical protein